VLAEFWPLYLINKAPAAFVPNTLPEKTVIPLTSNLPDGVVVPMPTLPEESIVNLSALFVPRDKHLDELKAILYTLKNSVIKHLKDGNMKRLRKRISKTKTKLHMFAIGLKSKCGSAYKFVKRSMNEIMTYS